MELRAVTLEEAAAFLKLHPEEVRRRAKCGLLPGGEDGKVLGVSRRRACRVCALALCSASASVASGSGKGD